jgi:hypothetical protein
MKPQQTFTALEVQAALRAVILYERFRAGLIFREAIRKMERIP